MRYKFVSVVFIFLFFSVESCRAQDIAFVVPKELKVLGSTVAVKGAVFNPSIAEVDIALVNISELVRESLAPKKVQPKKKPWLSTLSYITIPVAGAFFQDTFVLREGVNAIVAKPAGVEPTEKTIQMKVIVLDKTSPFVELKYPETDRLTQLKRISGRIKKKPYPQAVRITAEAIVTAEVKGEKRYQLRKLLDVTTPAKKGVFDLPVSLSEMLTGEEIVTITITADDVEVTKNLF